MLNATKKAGTKMPKIKRLGLFEVKVVFAPGLVVTLRGGRLADWSNERLIAYAEETLDWAQNL